jgi:hypothetical protein
MLPKLRIILAAMIATCAAVLALSAGLLGTRDPGNDLSGVPDVSRTLVRQAIVAEPEWQQLHLLAYSRRADELLRLRDLPATPARAVVDYAEQAQARAAETASASTAAASAPAATPSTAAPSAPATDSAAVVTAPGDTLPLATVALAPAATPPAGTSAALTAPVTLPAVEAPTVAAPVDTATAPAANAVSEETPAAASAPNGDTKVAAVQTGGSETAEMYGPKKPKAEAGLRHRAKAARARLFKPKSRAQVTHATRSVAPASATGFAVEQQNARSSNAEQNRSNGAFGSWRYGNDSTTR